MTDALTPLRPRLAAAAALALLASGCGMLRTSPGDDFQVLLFSTPDAVGRIEVPLLFGVRGCPSFTAEVEGALGRHAVQLAPDVDGTWRADVPVEWLRGEDGTCLHDAASPLRSKAKLLVTCTDVGRTATADLDVTYGTATHAFVVRPIGPSKRPSPQALFPTVDPLTPLALCPDAELQVGSLYPLHGNLPMWIDGAAAQRNPLVRPRMAAGGGVLFVTGGCPAAAACPDVPVPPSGAVAGELIHGVGLGPTMLQPSYHFWPDVPVPGHVVDLAFVGDALVVLSQAVDALGGDAGAVVTRVVPRTGAAEPWRETADVRVIGYYPGEQIQTRFSRGPDDTLSFLSFVIPPTEPGPIVPVLHTTDGLGVSGRTGITGTVSVGERVTAQWLRYGSLDMSPDGSLMVANGRWLGSADGPWSDLGPDHGYPGARDETFLGGAAWPAGAVALWTSFLDTQVVEAFSTDAPHARRYAYSVASLPGTSGATSLLGAVGVGDKLVLTTSTGIRLLSADGRLIGGADPLPCRLTPGGQAVETGPNHVAVPAGGNVYVFDLSTMEPPPPGP
jgi:hypothetical protein